MKGKSTGRFVALAILALAAQPAFAEPQVYHWDNINNEVKDPGTEGECVKALANSIIQQGPSGLSNVSVTYERGTIFSWLTDNFKFKAIDSKSGEEYDGKLSLIRYQSNDGSYVCSLSLCEGTVFWLEKSKTDEQVMDVQAHEICGSGSSSSPTYIYINH